jgi:hypothetical protein
MNPQTGLILWSMLSFTVLLLVVYIAIKVVKKILS